MIKYLGSKRLLLPDILSAVQSVRESGTVIDLFSGTSRVGHALKRAGYRVLSNDHNTYAHTLARCYVEADAEDVLDDARELIAELNHLARRPRLSRSSSALSAPSGHRPVATGEVGASPTKPVVRGRFQTELRRSEGSSRLTQQSPATIAEPASCIDFFTQTYCHESRFFHPKNGPRIHTLREEISRRKLPRDLEAVMLVSLMEAADRVDSTTGVQMAYLKKWAPRAHNDLELRVPDVLPRASSGKGAAVCLDAAAAAKELRAEAHIIYIDPPYNQHSYLGNYHIWETLVRWDAPEVYGAACKRIDCRERKSAFNSKRAMSEAMEALLDACGDAALIVSFSDEGYLTREELTAMLKRRGRVRMIERDYKRYVGAQIGIYNPSGEKVGRVSHLRNTEMIFVMTPRIRTATVRERKPSTGDRIRIRKALQVAAP